MTAIALERSKLTDRYQTTIPGGVRRLLNLNKGDRIAYRVEDGGRVYIEAAREDADEDPALGPFLDLLEADIRDRPERIRPIDGALLDRMQALTEGVEVDMDAPPSPEEFE